MNKLLTFFLIFIFLIESSFALTANSQSYSVSMFGNGISSGSANSINYNSVSLSESRGTTRNAEGLSFRGNVGFFEDSSYYRSVSITSYSVNPHSVVVGSTVDFYISALNAEQVWVKITPPNSQEYTLNLINGQSVSHLPIPSVVGIYQIVFYARSSTGAIASVVDSFVLTAQTSAAPNNNAAGSGSSGGGSTIVEKCTYNWDCTPWGVCFEGVQRRTCVNIGTCTGTESKPVEQTSCSESLFDIYLQLNGLSIVDDSISFNVDLTEKNGVEKIDVHIKYSIINSNNEEIFSQIETRAIQERLSYDKIISDADLSDGDYILRVDILYGNLQRAFAEQKFTISDGRLSSTITGFAGEGDNLGLKLNTLSVIFLIAILAIIVFVYLVIRRRKKLTSANSLLGLDGLEVYTVSGIRFGVIKDIVVKDNSIYGLAVELDSKLQSKLKRVLVRYSYVKSVKDVVLIDSYCLDYLQSHRNSFKNDMPDSFSVDPVAQPG